MIPPLIAAVASMVAAIMIAVVGHQEMDDRKRLCSPGVVVGAAAALLIVCLNPEIIRPTLTCFAYFLAILAIGIATTKMTKVVVHVRRHR